MPGEGNGPTPEEMGVKPLNEKFGTGSPIKPEIDPEKAKQALAAFPGGPNNDTEKDVQAADSFGKHVDTARRDETRQNMEEVRERLVGERSTREDTASSSIQNELGINQATSQSGMPKEFATPTYDTPEASQQSNEPKTLEEAKRLISSEWSLAMDDMDKDGQENGLYFSSYGDKSEEGVDSRVKILGETVDISPDKRGAIMITPDGPMALITDNANMLRSLRSEERMAIKGQASPDANVSATWVGHGGYKKEGNTITISRAPATEDLRWGFLSTDGYDYEIKPMKTSEDMKIVKEAIEKSKENRIIPAEKTIKDELQQLQNAKEIRGIINTPPST